MMGGGRGKGQPEPGGWLFGDVQQAGHGSLLVVCGGLSLSQGDIRVTADLSYSWTRDDGRASYLRAGDRVLVLVDAGLQDYYLLRKVSWQ